jgi:hypothetical protein
MFLRIAECARARPMDLALAFPRPDRGREYSWSGDGGDGSLEHRVGNVEIFSDSLFSA